ncbi:MAG: NADH-quinone oxidoreductase subunit J [archaeon]
MVTLAGWASLGGVVIFAALAVILRDMLKSILSLTIASVSLAAYFYLLGAPYAAVFEAIVAAGLITVLFLFMVSLTDTSVVERLEGRKAALVGLFAIALVAVAGFLWLSYVGELRVAAGSNFGDFGEALWTGRSIDVLAVTILIFVGVIGSMRLTTAGIEALEEESGTVGGPVVEDEAGRPAGPGSDEEPQEEVA